MKKILVFATLMALAAVSHAQTVIVPAAAAYNITLAWDLPAVCTAADPCTFVLYRIEGKVSIAAGTAGATTLLTTPAQAITAVDKTAQGGTTYSYAVETVQDGLNSGISTTATVTFPAKAAPAAPLGFTATVTP